MKLNKLIVATAMALAASATFAADTPPGALDLSSGSNSFGNSPTGEFADTYTFTLADTSWLIAGQASTTKVGSQDLDITSILIKSGGATVGSFVAKVGSNDVFESYALAELLLAPGAYSLVVSGINSQTKASYSGNVAVAAIPEPETYALMLAGLAAVGFIARRRKRV